MQTWFSWWIMCYLAGTWGTTRPTRLTGRTGRVVYILLFTSSNNCDYFKHHRQAKYWQIYKVICVTFLFVSDCSVLYAHKSSFSQGRCFKSELQMWCCMVASLLRSRLEHCWMYCSEKITQNSAEFSRIQSWSPEDESWPLCQSVHFSITEFGLKWKVRVWFLLSWA